MTMRELFGQKVFWVLFVVMACAGASEQGMSQWASAFAESGLGVSKTVGDLAGPCLFAALMGLSRAFYGKFGEKISLHKYMMASGVLCVVTYLVAGLSKSPVLGLLGCAFCGLAVGIMWPGTCSTGAKVLRRGGTVMFALFALAGDIGCAAGPGLVGVAADFFGNDLKKGILAAVIFPVLLMTGVYINQKISCKLVK